MTLLVEKSLLSVIRSGGQAAELGVAPACARWRNSRKRNSAVEAHSTAAMELRIAHTQRKVFAGRCEFPVTGVIAGSQPTIQTQRSACGTRGSQTERDGRVRRSAWLGGMLIFALAAGELVPPEVRPALYQFPRGQCGLSQGQPSTWFVVRAPQPSPAIRK